MSHSLAQGALMSWHMSDTVTGTIVTCIFALTYSKQQCCRCFSSRYITNISCGSSNLAFKWHSLWHFQLSKPQCHLHRSTVNYCCLIAVQCKDVSYPHIRLVLVMCPHLTTCKSCTIHPQGGYVPCAVTDKAGGCKHDLSLYFLAKKP